MASDSAETAAGGGCVCKTELLGYFEEPRTRIVCYVEATESPWVRVGGFVDVFLNVQESIRRINFKFVKRRRTEKRRIYAFGVECEPKYFISDVKCPPPYTLLLVGPWVKVGERTVDRGGSSFTQTKPAGIIDSGAAQDMNVLATISSSGYMQTISQYMLGPPYCDEVVRVKELPRDEHEGEEPLHDPTGEKEPKLPPPPPTSEPQDGSPVPAPLTPKERQPGVEAEPPEGDSETTEPDSMPDPQPQPDPEPYADPVPEVPEPVVPVGR